MIRAGSRSAILPCFNPLQSAKDPVHEHPDGHGSGSERSEPPWIALNPVTWNTSSTKLTARAGCGIFTHRQKLIKKLTKSIRKSFNSARMWERTKFLAGPRQLNLLFAFNIMGKRADISASAPAPSLRNFFPPRWNQSSIPRRALPWAETPDDCRRPQREGFWVL